MRILRSLALLAVALFLGLSAVQAKAAQNQENSAQGYSIRANGDKIDLMFPDGSVLHTPRNADLKTLDGVSAEGGGMAQQMLDQAYADLGLSSSGAQLPKAFGLAQNSPNPFNPSTTISYNIPESSPQVMVELSVYNLRGQVVRTLVRETKGPGQYSVNWDGTDEGGRRVSSGVYFYRIQAGEYRATRKMVVLK
ncbi:T9SS type A sorting domain-containing protein [bacterium]|nr:T9SS type A sorting domain-containing protein [bacterium]